MTVLPAIDIFEKYVSNSRDKTFSDINSIFFNDNNNILISTSYLDLIESTFDSELINLLVVELSDNNRISPDIIDNNEDNIFEKLYEDNCNNIDCLCAITLNETLSIDHYKYSRKDKKSKNKDFLIFELLKSNIISFHYYDFDTDLEIQKLLKTTFSLPKKLSKINIYNRYSEYNYLTFLANKSIHYFNLISGSYHIKKLEFIRIENDLKANLGRNLILKSTHDLKLLHERKIFFNHFILTFDQALDNLKVTEPNWKIDIEVDRKSCLNEWSKKNGSFVKHI